MCCAICEFIVRLSKVYPRRYINHYNTSLRTLTSFSLIIQATIGNHIYCAKVFYMMVCAKRVLKKIDFNLLDFTLVVYVEKRGCCGHCSLCVYIIVYIS